MTKQIADYTAYELFAKIEAIKDERERTANALKRYEEELERRKNKNWLPLKEEVNFTTNKLTLSTACIEIKVREGFYDEDSFHKYLSALKSIRKAWFDNSKGEPIDIEVLKPLLKKGWVAYEKEYGWIWFNNKPFILRGTEEDAAWSSKGSFGIIGGFNLKPADNWEESLQECGL